MRTYRRQEDTVQPYTSPTVAMKAVMDGNGEVAYTADIGMTQFHQRIGGFKGYQPKVPEIVHTWYAYRDPRRDDVLPDAAAGDARHHDRAVHRHRLHQPDGGHAAAPRRVARDRARPDGLGFGWLVGAGLPPTATYIILAVITVPPMRAVGIDPWVAHFFAFLLAVWGELSPPTSLTAAVASRIAETSFMRTMWEALKLCLPITFMSFAIFVRSDMVVSTGWAQIADTLLVAIAICGITCAIFARFTETLGSNVMLRATLALASFVVMLHPDGNVAAAAAALVLPASIYGVARHRRIAPVKSGALQSQPAG